MYKRAFNFCQDVQDADSIQVLATDFYTPERGYGFVTEKNKQEQMLLAIPELNAGFTLLPWYQNTDLTIIEQNSDGCYVASKQRIEQLAAEEGGAYPGEQRRNPLIFKLDMEAQGNYQVELTIHAAESMEQVIVFMGRRHLAFKGNIAAGDTLRITHAVNVCDIIPRGHTEVFEDTTLDIAILADQPRISALQVKRIDVPTVYIAGDSTVTDQSASYPYAPGTSYGGWGQFLSAYSSPELAISNHAHSGLTTESFRSEGHDEIVKKYWKPGDYLFIQFGHNDQKLKHLKASNGYRNNLLTYIQEAREHGVFPILVTPLARNSWKNSEGAYNDLLLEYAACCIAVGELENVPVVDLHKHSKSFIIRSGLEGAKSFFYPGDFTHTNDYGAYMMAGYIAKLIKQSCEGRMEHAYRFLAGCMRSGGEEWLPNEQIVLPEKPACYANLNIPDKKDLFAGVERIDEAADRAFALDLIIKACKFFPVNVYNDLFDDVVGHEWYAGVIECAIQNELIVPQMVENGCIFPEKLITLEEYLVCAIRGYQCRRKLPQTETSPYDKRCAAYALKYIQAACALHWLSPDGKDDLSHKLSRREIVNLCRILML